MTTPSNTARINIRINEDLKQTIEASASLMGQSLTDFVTSTLVSRARAVQNEAHVTELSHRDRDLFLSLLEDDPAPSKSVIDAVKDYREWQRGESSVTIYERDETLQSEV